MFCNIFNLTFILISLHLAVPCDFLTNISVGHLGRLSTVCRLVCFGFVGTQCERNVAAGQQSSNAKVCIFACV